ncbi:MAG: N-formylglutamate amidohydrolase [Gammaproteobacteria bacterium]|nr:N-formylglutamate amidohydrolase [Gammaproteobacteria bacterium]
MELIGPEDPQPYEIVNPGGSENVLITCDHASRSIPEALSGMGLDSAALDKHIAWDIGAGAVSRGLAGALRAKAVLAGYSRLVIDCNRSLSDPSSILEVSDEIVVPGNRGLAEHERRARQQAVFYPYHKAISGLIHDFQGRGIAPALISVHSFTPYLQGEMRPWHVGVLWDKDGRLPQPLLAALRTRSDLVVGDNLPYSGKHPSDYTIDHHAEAAGLPHVSLEIRQDLLESPEGVETWVKLLSEVLSPILADESLYTAAEY